MAKSQDPLLFMVRKSSTKSATLEDSAVCSFYNTESWRKQISYSQPTSGGKKKKPINLNYKRLITESSRYFSHVLLITFTQPCFHSILIKFYLIWLAPSPLWIIMPRNSEHNQAKDTGLQQAIQTLIHDNSEPSVYFYLFSRTVVSRLVKIH